MSIAIRIEEITKQYQIGAREPYRTLRETLVHAASAPFRRLSGTGASRGSETISALDGVSFTVDEGDIVGLIGRNGGGKSTLLKILSRVTEPTRGRVMLRGRVGALLEVGTGFHPELTGRENMYLHGAILGMRRAEIDRKFDEIVAFAEISAFLDTPVKRYSSGMFARLGFAIAAHLETDILLVDEVLAVGDVSFQRRCLQKMESVAQGGRTVIFVSHNVSAITRLCPRAILLDGGRLVADGPSPKVVSQYMQSGSGTTAERQWTDLVRAPGDGVVRLRAVRVRAHDGSVSETLDIRRPCAVEMEFVVLEGGHRLVPNLQFTNEDGTVVFVSIEVDSPWHRRPRPPGRYVTRAVLPGNFLAEGTLRVSAAVSTLDPVRVHVHECDAVGFQLVDSLVGDSARGDFGGFLPGVVRPLLRWETVVAPNSGSSAENTAGLESGNVGGGM